MKLDVLAGPYSRCTRVKHNIGLCALHEPMPSLLIGRYMDSDSFFRMAGSGRSIESWLAGLNDVRIDLWRSDPEPKPQGPHDRFFVVGLGGNPMTGAGCEAILALISCTFPNIAPALALGCTGRGQLRCPCLDPSGRDSSVSAARMVPIVHAGPVLVVGA